MSTFDNLSPSAAAVVKIFVYGFQSAPTADLIAELSDYLDNGGTPQELLDLLFHYDASDSPYPDFADSTDAEFIEQLIACLADGTSVSAEKRDAWADELLTIMAGYEDRAEFAIAVAELIETLDTDDPDLLAVRESLRDRLDQAAAFAETPEGATWDGEGFSQLQAALDQPVPVPTYALEASAERVDEGDTVTIVLQTTHLAEGTEVAYTLSGISEDDLVDGALQGVFTVDAEGRATLTLTLRADALTEGLETLRLTLDDVPDTQVEVIVDDTSLTPEEGSEDETVVVSDDMDLPGAGAPATAEEGEIAFDSFLTFDLLDQSGAQPSRLSVADLIASGDVAGAPPVSTDHRADRGNLPQVSNAQLLTLDLGDGTDRVDYAAESGLIVAVVPAANAEGPQFVLVNDDGTDLDFSGATDRVDALTGVEEIVASGGGGVLDLTASGRAWTISFSDGFTQDSADVDAATDRALHRIVLRDADSGEAAATQYLEARDAGLHDDIAAGTAAWTRIEGSDQAETLLYTSHESTDARTAHLRGGDNAVSFAALTQSIAVQVAITPFAASTDPADDRNDTGRLTATTRFTGDDGEELADSQPNVTTSYTPDNAVAAGSLHITGSQDTEDAIGFEGTAQALQFTLGRADGSTGARLIGQSGGDALRFSGFEALLDNGDTDDVFSVQNLALALQGPRLVDAEGDDRDTLQIFDEALGHAALGGEGRIDLGTLSGAEGFGYRFATLDIRGITEGEGLAVSGTAAADETLVVGDLAPLGSVTGFETLRLTDASFAADRPLVLDLDAGKLRDESGTLLAFDGSRLSVEGATQGLALTVVGGAPGAGAMLTGGDGADRFTGGAGDDVFRGGRGDDVLDGSAGADRFIFEASGVLNGRDTLLNFGLDDRLDVTAFTGAPITAAAEALDGAVGGTFEGGADTLQFVFNRSEPLTAADFATEAQAGRFVLADGMKVVVAVSADPTGERGDAENTPIHLYYVENGAGAGLGDLTVSLVATISGADELGFADLLAAFG